MAHEPVAAKDEKAQIYRSTNWLPWSYLSNI